MKAVIKIGAAALAGVAVLSAGAAVGQGAPDPNERAIETRHSVMTLIGWSMGPVFGVMRGAPYDAAAAEVTADRVAALSLMIDDAFEMDTSASDIETEALDVIWTDWDGFQEKSAALHEAAVAMQAAVASGDEDAAKAAIGAVGQSCGGCHDTYRAE